MSYTEYKQKKIREKDANLQRRLSSKKEIFSVFA